MLFPCQSLAQVAGAFPLPILLLQAQEAAAALYGGGIATSGAFLWGQYRGMEALVVAFCPDSLRTSGRCCCEGWVWKRPKMGSRALCFR